MGGKPGESAETGLPDLTQQTTFQLIVLLNFIMRPFFASVGRLHNLTLTEWRVLFIVAAHPGITGTEISRAYGFDKMNLCRAVRHLHKTGHLARAPGEADRRRSHLTVTTMGAATVKAIAPNALEREVLMDKALPPEEMIAFRRTLETLTALVRDSSDD